MARLGKEHKILEGETFILIHPQSSAIATEILLHQGAIVCVSLLQIFPS